MERNYKIDRTLPISFEEKKNTTEPRKSFFFSFVPTVLLQFSSVYKY